MKTLKEIKDRIAQAEKDGFGMFRVFVPDAMWTLVEISQLIGGKVVYSGPVGYVMMDGWKIKSVYDERGQLDVVKV